MRQILLNSGVSHIEAENLSFVEEAPAVKEELRPLHPEARQIDLAAAPPLPGDAAFHCQQATEKALKAFLA